MQPHRTTETTPQRRPSTTRIPIGAWARANALGLCVTLLLFASASEGMEALGAEHDTVAWGVPTLIAMVAGGCVLAWLRRRVLGADHHGSPWQILIIGVGVTVGFVVGWIPPLDFVLGILAAGTVGGAVQLRQLRQTLGRPGRLALLGAGAWLVAGVAAVAMAILVADVLLVETLGLGDLVNGAGGFAAILALIGLISGAVGGSVEAASLRS